METSIYSLRSIKRNLLTENSFLVSVGYKLLSCLLVFAIWHLAASHYNNSLLLPKPLAVLEKFFLAIKDQNTLINLGITMGRVLKGFFYALIIGVPLGFFMGYVKPVEELLGSLIDSLRQVPIMAWVPLTIVWFGIGDGPTIFLIAFGGLFPIVLNTIHAVKSVPKNYYNAAKSMGAGEVSMFFNITLPSALPDILTGSRLAISTGWMSVIWAEFVATSAGLGHSMVQAQSFMDTEQLIALMFLAALVGVIIDRLLTQLNKKVTKWRYI